MTIKENAKAKIILNRNQLNKISLSCSIIEEKQYNFEFLVKSEKDKIKVQVYFGKKGIKTVLQGNSDSNTYKKVYSIIFDEIEILSNNSLEEPKEYIGSDESGKGDVFGPLVTTAFFVDEKTKLRLLQFGVKDSKELSEFQITEIAKKIRAEFPNNFETIQLFPEKYNEIYPKYNNLNALLIWTHSTAISNLLKKYKCNNIIVDKFSSRRLNIANNNYDNKLDILQITNGERFIGVAAASIIARDTFNKWFNNMKIEFYNIPKGASKNVENTVQLLIEKYSADKLKEIAKIHFKTVQKFL